MFIRDVYRILCFLATASAFAAGVDFLPSGALSVDDTARFGVAHYSDRWEPGSQLDPGLKAAVTREESSFRYRLDWPLRGGCRADLSLKVTPAGPGCRLLEYEFRGDRPIPTNSLSLQMESPVHLCFGRPIRLNGTEFLFPEKTPKNSTIAVQKEVRRIEIPLRTGLLIIEPRTPADVMLVDFRVFRQNNFGLRINFTPFNGKITRSSLALYLRFEPYQVRKLNLAAAANMGFVDEVADDRKGGWTDQGPLNDLRALKERKIEVPPVEFEILDPAKNNGNSCLVLGGGGRQYFPKHAAVAAGGERLRTLFLLHAIAWPPAQGTSIGTITARFRDGSRYMVPVVAGRDVGNWWQPTQLKNGIVAWQGSSPESSVGLYLSRFELPDKPLAGIDFDSNGKSVWMIVAACGSPQQVYFAEAISYRFLRDENWRPFTNQREVKAGSALDFSFLLDAPAGKYGPIRNVNGHFEFENQPGRTVRFYGVNLCMWANFLSREECDQLAERLSRIGYNAVRFHHFDRDVIQAKSRCSTELDMQRLDQMDYLFAALKKRGIYITTDLFSLRSVRPGEFKQLPQLLGGRNYKLAAMLLPEVNANLKEFARRIFSHKNPYTGLTWGEDPALIGVSIINENTILHLLGFISNSPLQPIVQKQFEEWCRAGSITVTEANRKEELHRFLLEKYARYYQDMKLFLRKVGVRAPITDQNYISTPNAFSQRSRYDYVDNHMYWDHPLFLGKAWSLPAQFRNESVLLSRLKVPAELGPVRVFGLPYTITEFDYCYPNRCRGEGAVVFGAYAAMQDWSGVYRFAYSHSRDNMFSVDRIETFDVVNDPVRLLTERIGMAFFIRADVKVADEAFPVAVSKRPWQNYRGVYPPGAQELTLFGRTGSVQYDGGGRFTPALPPGSRAVYALTPELKKGSGLPLLTGKSAETVLPELRKNGLLSAADVSDDLQRIRSLTGELSADLKAGTFLAVTPRSEAMILPEANQVQGRFLRARATLGFAVLAAIALDGEPLREARRILLLHVTDVQEEGIRYATRDMQVILENATSRQLLARRGVAELELRTAGTGWKLFALDFSGQRLGEIPVRTTKEGIRFTADSFAGKNVVFAYELIR